MSNETDQVKDLLACANPGIEVLKSEIELEPDLVGVKIDRSFQIGRAKLRADAMDGHIPFTPAVESNAGDLLLGFPPDRTGSKGPMNRLSLSSSLV